jgi:hypothetical protein
MNSDYPLPRFLDVEASSFAASSYPIEIGWSDNNGNINSYLINPGHVRAWTDWDFHAQLLHGISREQCMLNGFNPEFVCRQLSQSIRPGEIIYADAGKFDQYWIDALYFVGSSIGYSQFRVLHSAELMLPMLIPFDSDIKKRWRILEKLRFLARKKIGRRHRVTADVQSLILTYKFCLELQQKYTR